MKTPIERTTDYINDSETATRNPINVLKELRARLVQDGGDWAEPKVMQKENKTETDMRTTNPHWIGDEPAWDIQLTENILLKDVTERQILYLTRKHIDESYIYETIVRQYHIDALKKVKLKVRLA